FVGDRREHAEVKYDDDRDKGPKQHEEFALGGQISFAGLINQLRYFKHRAMNGKIFQPRVDDQSKSQSKNAKKYADQQQIVTIHAQELNAGKVGQFEIGFAANLFRLSQGRRSPQSKKKKKGCCRLSNAVCFR